MNRPQCLAVEKQNGHISHFCPWDRDCEIITVDFAYIFAYTAIMDTKSATLDPIPVSYDFLKDMYKEYRSPKDKISRLVRDGSLIRLRKGLFMPFSDNVGGISSLGAAANLLLGPSYVSLQTALSFYGMIPEQVFAVRSMTTRRGKLIPTPIGRFDYRTVRKDYFSIGIRTAVRDSVSFLIASPEKAVCDMIIATAGLKIQSKKAMRAFLEDDMRIQFPENRRPDMADIDKVLETGIKRREIHYLREYMKEYIEDARQSI